MNEGKLNALIVDDEQTSIETLKGLLEEYCPEVEVCGTFSNPIDAMKAVAELKPELLFLDIQMPEINGLDFLKIIRNHPLHTIYVTGHQEYAIQALRLHAADYLLKPVDPEVLQSAVKNAKANIHHGEGQKEPSPKTKNGPSSKDYLRVPHQDGFRMVYIPDILRIEADNSYSTISLRDGLSLVVSKGIRDFDSLLPGDAFVRVHRSHIINLRFVFAYSVTDGGQVTLSNGELVPVSRRRLKILKDKLDQWSTKLG